MLNRNKTGLGSSLARLGVAAATLCLSGFATALTVGDRVENFRLMDHAGASHELHYFADAPAMVLMAHNTQCTSMQTDLQSLASLHQQFAPKGAEVMLINSDLRDDRSAISASANSAGVDLPILFRSNPDHW